VRPSNSPSLFGSLILTLGWLLAGLSSPAVAAIYHFIDARGVVHFSDVPRDARYERVARGPAPSGLVLTPFPHPKTPEHHGFDAVIERLALAYGLEAALVKAVVAAESNFRVDAVSRVGALGLMQLMPATADEMGVRKPLRPRENLEGGVRYLKAMFDRFGDVRRALAAYNAGPSAVERYAGIPPYPETEAYVERVLNYYRGYRDEFRR